MQAAVAVSENIKRAGDTLTEEVRAAVYRLTQLEQQANTSSGIGHDGKKKWHLTSPKDMVPDVFIGKDETWLQWKEATEDYAEACHPGLKHAMEVAAKVSGPITDCSQLVGVMEAEWLLASGLFVLLKTKTTSEAPTLVTSAGRDNSVSPGGSSSAGSSHRRGLRE